MSTNTPDITHNLLSRVVNLARLLAHLLCTFHLPLAVLKPIDIGANLNASMILFLATFFMSLFSAKVSEDTFQVFQELSSVFSHLLRPLVPTNILPYSYLYSI